MKLLQDLEAVGIRVTLVGADLKVHPASKLSSELRERLKAEKAELVEALRTSIRVRARLALSVEGRVGYLVNPETGAQIYPPQSSPEWLAWRKRSDEAAIEKEKQREAKRNRGRIQ
jgi:hypothetical protein